MIEDESGYGDLWEHLAQRSRRNKARVAGVATLFVVAGVLAGLFYAGYSYLGLGHETVRAGQIQAVSVSSTGIAGLERWSIDGVDLDNQALRERYNELYNYTYPYLLREAIKEEIIPRGVPAVYGEELGVSFDGDMNRMTSILRRYEDHPLDEAQMKRYKDVGLRIACEYCCNAKALIFEDGRRACGCAHSYAMRGLAKYLIINHPEEYSNDEILLELGRWKAAFFPKQTISKALRKYAEAGNIDPSVLTDMPDMVGSC